MKLSLLPKSNLISIFFSKKVFLCLVVLCFVGSVFGAEYVWTGRGDGSTWTDKDNWGGSGYPGESDNATFSSGAEVTITSDITVNQIYLNASSKVTCDSNVTISLNSIITQGEFLNKGTLQKRENVSFIIKVEAGGKLINENKIICTDIEGLGNSNITNNGTIEASGAATFQSGANFTNANTSKLYIGGAMRNEGSFTNSGGTVTVEGTTTNTGTITNTGNFTSKGEIKNNDGGKITNNFSGTISGYINNTGGTVTNNGGTISDEVSGGTFEDNPIVVYSTIDSPDTVLDWTVDSSWENGVKPDISGGDTAVIITLNGDVNISDFQAFFSEGNEKITLNGTGNLLYNGKKIYISQKSDTELNWNTAENWINGVVPIITGEGNQEVVIVLNSDFISSETLVFNNATGAKIHIYLCGKIISAESVQLVSGWTHPDNNPAGNIHFYGPGTVETKILDASNNTNRTSTHEINLYDGTIFKITEHAYADPARGKIKNIRGDCEVYLPASGFDMRVPSGNNDGATFVVVGTQAKAIEPQSYYKIELTSDISDTEKIFTFSRSETGKHNYDLNFPYVVYLMGDASWKLGDTELRDGFEGNVTIPSNNIENGTSQIEKTISLSSGTVESGDGIKVIFYTPCKNLVLNEFIYEKEIIYWTGDVSEDFLTPENWTFEGNPLTNLGDLTGKVVKIPSSYTRAPTLSSDISLKKLIIEDGATLTISENGKLTVEKINIVGNGSLNATAGTVVFSGDNSKYSAENPDLSTFGTIEVVSGTFYLATSLQAEKLKINNDGTLDLAGSTVISDEIVNDGTIRANGGETLQNSSGTTIGITNSTENSTVVYYYDPSITDGKIINIPSESGSAQTYINLVIESGFSGSCDRGIIIKNSLKFKNSSGNYDLVCENLGSPNVAELSGVIELKNLTDFAEIKFAGNGIFTGTIESSKNTKLTSDYGRICFDSNIDANFNSPLTVQTNALDQGFLPAGTINLGSTCEVLCNLYLTNQVSFNIGGKLSVGTEAVPKDVYISAMEAGSPLDVEIAPKDTQNQEFQVYGNFLLLNGNAKISTDLTVGKDMILLNGENPAMFNDPISGIEGLFAYNLSGRGVGGKTAAINFTNDFPTTLPKGTASGNNQDEDLDSTKYVSTFDFATGKTILVWNNFYNNGVDLGTNTTGSWNLKFPANDVATSSFAECYNATIKNCVVAANTSPGEAWLSTENCTADGTGNTNVAFSKAIFANVATISDNIIRVSFVDGNSPLDEKPEIKIENSCNEISTLFENFRFNISSERLDGVAFSGIFANPECTEDTNDKGDLSTFYLKYEIPTDGSIDYRWNTDATGDSVGSTDSTDTSGVHKTVVPNLLFKRAIEASYAGFRDEHKNRLVSVGTGTTGAEPLYEDTIDNAPPVLVAVTLGQEQHETEAIDQHHYDSHNFIEWQFSEPVEFENYPENGISQIDGVETSAESENIQSTTNFGKITNNENGFSVAGFGSFETGKVSLGSKTGSGEVNAFYRKFALEAGEEALAQKNRIRLSIAGYVDEENPVVVNGVDYKNWLGFIDSKNTSIPSGTFTMSEEYSKSIKDLADNEGISPKDSIITNAIYSSMSQDLQTKTLYGTWDIDPPVVANYMKETSSGIYAQELLAVNNTGGNTAENLEIHFLDNSAYNTLEGKNNLQWRTKIGWKENSVQITQTIPLDTKGGSRMTSDYNKTLGGLRFSTIIDSLDAFVCQNITTKEYIDLIESEAGFSQTTTNENIFGESDVNQFDVPYLTLKFEDAKGSLLKHNYELKYNTEKGFITDLAGNLLYDFTVKSPDKNPPQFLLSIGGVNYDKLYILFSKPIDYLNQNNEPDEGKLRRIVKSLSVFESTPDGEKDTGLIDYKLGSKAKVVTKTKESTGIEISLTRKVSYDELKNLYIGVNTFDSTNTDEDEDSSLGDPITGESGEYSMLYDMFENPISADSKHCFSDFAVNAFDVLYAYDGRAVEEAALAQGVFGGNQWTVTDFSGETNNSSKIIAGKDITIAGKIVDSSENPDEQDKFSMLADISPAKNKAGLNFEDYTDIKTRLWFPDFVKLFPVNNSSTSENFTTDNLVDNGKIETDIDGKDNNSFTYVIPNNKDDSQSVNWADGDEFEFLFKIYNSDNEVVMVDGNVDGDTDDEVDHPLFALRLKDENDITSIDLWSLHIVELVRQKGGTTILNNVINSLNNEETVVEVQVPQTGFLTVQVLTLDGNVVKVLQRGRVEEGTYYYKWNGTNISGAAVARGMYFVRVVGPNIDETRKVMVIKE